jgi:dolichol-phosphate mannosyltransferase
MRVSVIIPAHNEAAHITEVISSIPSGIESIIVVDDCSSDATVARVQELSDPRVTLIQHQTNQGVGGATVSGYTQALKDGSDVAVKIDGDGQMDPLEIEALVEPLLRGEADYSKGFRFHSRTSLGGMPWVRLLGNVGLSFLTKAASGYWDIFDPTSGFTAIHRSALERIPFEKLPSQYLFETNMLIQLSKLRAVVRDVEISCHYGDETSGLDPKQMLLQFPPMLTKATLRRVLWQYFIRDFGVASLFLLTGLPLLLFGLSFGVYHWSQNAATGTSTPAGTVMIAVMGVIIGFQLLLQAVVVDVNNVPKKPLQRARTEDAQNANRSRRLSQ